MLYGLSRPCLPIGRRRARTRTRILAHQQLLAKSKQGHIDVYFEGDSITRRWGATDYSELLANWKRNFFGWNAADFGWGADKVENILWRLENGELDGVNQLPFGCRSFHHAVGNVGRGNRRSDHQGGYRCAQGWS